MSLPNAPQTAAERAPGHEHAGHEHLGESDAPQRRTDTAVIVRAPRQDRYDEERSRTAGRGVLLLDVSGALGALGALPSESAEQRELTRRSERPKREELPPMSSDWCS